MKIEKGTPRETGHYVCYMHGVEVPTVVRFWLAGGTGWIGPLPYNENALDFDL